MLNTEIWKDVPDLPYEISNLGNVQRRADATYKYKRGGYVKPYLNNKGYLCIHCYKEGKMYSFTIHRLIAQMFIPNPNNLPVINHIDGNPLNNSIDNLEWCTQQHNMQHAWDTGLNTNRHACASVKRNNGTSTYKGVSWSEQRKRWCVYVTFDKKRYGVGRYKEELDAAKAYDEFLVSKDLLQHGYKLNFG